MSVHRVDIEIESVARGPGLGQIRSWTAVSTNKKCRCKELDAAEDKTLLRDGVKANWRVYFFYNPHIDERNRLKFTDSSGVVHYLRVKAGPINPHQLDYFWKVDAEEFRSVDNPAA